MKTFEEYIFEASIGRFYQHVEKEHPILVVTASRSDRSQKENEKLNKELRRFVRLTGFGYVRVIGKYPEEVVDENGEKKVVDATDDSVIITTDAENAELLLELGKKLGKKYKQDSILFFGNIDDSNCSIDNEKPYHSVLIGTRSDSSIGGMYKVHRLGKLHFNQPSEIITKIKKDFYNIDWEPESVDVIKPKKASGVNEAMTMNAFRKFLIKENDLDDWN